MSTGRICVAALNMRNLDAVANAIAQVLKDEGYIDDFAGAASYRDDARAVIAYLKTVPTPQPAPR